MRSERLRGLALDAGLTLILLVWGIGGTYPASQDQLDTSRAPDGWAYLLVILAALPFVLRRRYPVAVLVASGSVVLTYLAAGYAFGPILFTIPAAAYTVGALLPKLPAVRWVGAYYVLLLAITVPRMVRAYDDGLWRQITVLAVVSLAAFGAPLTTGIAVRARRESEAGARAAMARRAVTEERLRMAQELHDSVGHGLAVIAMQAGVALHVLEREPAKVREALEAIRDTSRRSLDGLRTQLQGMREPSADAPRRPVVGIDELDVLLDRIRAGGMDVQIDLDAAVRDGDLPPDVEVAAYRIVQESLTNVLRHAHASRADVRIRRAGGAVVVDVLDDGTAAARYPADGTDRTDSGGSGIPGMRARAESLGGTLQAGPRAGGGFAVHARLPLTEEVPRSDL